MPEIPVTAVVDPSTTQAESGAVEKLSQTLDEWRARIDELVVQADLAGLDVREVVRQRLEMTENVYLAARARVSDARQVAETNVGNFRQVLDQLLHDLRLAYDDAEAVIKRSRES